MMPVCGKVKYIGDKGAIIQQKKNVSLNHTDFEDEKH